MKVTRILPRLRHLQERRLEDSDALRRFPQLPRLPQLSHLRRSSRGLWQHPKRGPPAPPTKPVMAPDSAPLRGFDGSVAAPNTAPGIAPSTPVPIAPPINPAVSAPTPMAPRPAVAAPPTAAPADARPALIAETIPMMASDIPNREMPRCSGSDSSLS